MPLLNQCPDFKGIETAVQGFARRNKLLNQCPDFKGIETPCGQE